MRSGITMVGCWFSGVWVRDCDESNGCIGAVAVMLAWLCSDVLPKASGIFDGSIGTSSGPSLGILMPTSASVCCGRAATRPIAPRGFAWRRSDMELARASCSWLFCCIWACMAGGNSEPILLVPLTEPVWPTLGNGPAPNMPGPPPKLGDCKSFAGLNKALPKALVKAGRSRSGAPEVMADGQPPRVFGAGKPLAPALEVWLRSTASNAFGTKPRGKVPKLDAWSEPGPLPG